MRETLPSFLYSTTSAAADDDEPALGSEGESMVLESNRDDRQETKALTSAEAVSAAVPAAAIFVVDPRAFRLVAEVAVARRKCGCGALATAR